jgi:hypothetical protein
MIFYLPCPLRMGTEPIHSNNAIRISKRRAKIASQVCNTMLTYSISISSSLSDGAYIFFSFMPSLTDCRSALFNNDERSNRWIGDSRITTTIDNSVEMTKKARAMSHSIEISVFTRWIASHIDARYRTTQSLKIMLCVKLKIVTGPQRTRMSKVVAIVAIVAFSNILVHTFFLRFLLVTLKEKTGCIYGTVCTAHFIPALSSPCPRVRLMHLCSSTSTACRTVFCDLIHLYSKNRLRAYSMS